MKSIHRLSFVLFLIGLVGCSEFFPQKFSTTASYDAPQSGFRIVIKAHGKIPPGEDITEGGTWKAEITPLGAVIAKTVTMQTVSGSSVTYVIDGQPKISVDRWALELEKILADAGFTGLLKAEVDEVAQVIEGAASGPKGTTMAGQSKSLTVVEVK